MRNDKSPTEPTGEVTSMRNQAWLGERSRVTASGSSRSLFNRQAPGGSGESPQVELPTASTAPHVPSARHQLWMGQRASCTAMGSSHALMRRQGSAEGGADEAQVTDIELERNTETSSSFSKRDSPRNVERHKALWLGHRASCKATGSSRALHHREPGSLDRPLPKLRTVGAIAARLRAATTLASAANEGAARHAADAKALPLINPAVADTLLDAAAAAPRAQSDETNAALADAFLAAVSVRRANSFSRPRGGGAQALERVKQSETPELGFLTPNLPMLPISQSPNLPISQSPNLPMLPLPLPQLQSQPPEPPPVRTPPDDLPDGLPDDLPDDLPDNLPDDLPDDLHRYGRPECALSRSWRATRSWRQMRGRLIPSPARRVVHSSNGSPRSRRNSRVTNPKMRMWRPRGAPWRARRRMGRQSSRRTIRPRGRSRRPRGRSRRATISSSLDISGYWGSSAPCSSSCSKQRGRAGPLRRPSSQRPFSWLATCRASTTPCSVLGSPPIYPN